VEREPLVTLEAVGLKTLSELYELDPAEVVKRMDEGNVPVNPGDAFLAVLLLRGVHDLREATLDLDKSTERLARLTRALVGLTVALLVVAATTLVVAS
jgi:hypothetical protein